MGSREVPFELDVECDYCGHVGAFDFMGDYACQACVASFMGARDEDVGDGYEDEC